MVYCTKWQNDRKNKQGKNFDKRDFLDLFFLCARVYSTLLHQIPQSRRMLVSNLGLLRLWHWQSDGPPKSLDLIHNSDISHSHSARSHPHSARSHPYWAIFFLTNCSYFVVGSESRARIWKPFKEPRNRFPAWRAGMTILFDVLARPAT